MSSPGGTQVALVVAVSPSGGTQVELVVEER